MPEDIALCYDGVWHEAIYHEAFACTVIGFCSAGQSGGWVMAGDRKPVPDGQRAVLRPDPNAQASLAAIGRAIEAATAAGCAALREAEIGISPHRYLKMRRMGMVRAALRSRGGPWHSVKAIALSNGCWHLGQLARDYRAIYGEAPSQVLSCARIACQDAEDAGKVGDGIASYAA